MSYAVYHFCGDTKKTVWHQEATLANAVKTMRSLCQGRVPNIVNNEFFDVEFQSASSKPGVRDKVTIFANFGRMIAASKHRHDVYETLDTKKYSRHVAHCPLKQTPALETFAVVRQGSKDTWVSATTDFETALSEYKNQLGQHAEADLPDLPGVSESPVEKEMFTYSKLVCDTWTGIIRDPAQAEQLRRPYKHLVLYHVDSGLNVPSQPTAQLRNTPNN